MSPPDPSFASPDQALGLARAALGYLAQADVASLPAVTQARLLRELERAEAQHTAARARVLSVFDWQDSFRDDGHGGPHPWLTWQTKVTPKAASGALDWMHRLRAHPVVADALAAGQVSASYARKICEWASRMPAMYRDAAAQILVSAAADGAGLDDLSGMAEDMYARVAQPDTDSSAEERRFRNRFFALTRLFQGHGKADGDLTPQCLAAVQEVLDTLGKKTGPEDTRTVGQRRHDALEEAMRLLLSSGCLPDRAGQPAMVQLHMTLDELMGLPGAAGAARTWLSDHLGTGEPGSDQPGTGPADSEVGTGQPGPGETADRLRRLLSPDPQHDFARPDPRAARHHASAAEKTGWLTGQAAEAYACDAKMAPMVCGHLDRNLLARLVAALVGAEPGSPATSTTPASPSGPRCECDEHPARRRAPMPGALFSTGLPGLPGPASIAAADPDAAALDVTAPTPGGLARLQDTLLRYAVGLLSGPAGLASYLRTQLTGGFFPSASLPLDLGEPTEQVPPHLRRAVIKRDRHCSFPGCAAPAVRCHVHHLIPRSKGGPTRLDNLTLLCHFHHLIAIHRWGWTLTLHADGTTTAISPDRIRTLHSHGPPPGQDSLWPDPPGHSPPATAA